MVLLLISAVGCSTVKVDRVAVDTQIDLSGGWNDTDAMLVAKEMVADCLNKPWVGRFEGNQGRSPLVIVGPVKNLSQEHIDSQVFTKYLERELLNSGRVTFVADKNERGAIREEREDQQMGNTSAETMAKLGAETGADYMMIGSIHTVQDQFKGKSVMFYQVNLEMIDMSTNQKTWIGQKQIKKQITRSKYSL